MHPTDDSFRALARSSPWRWTSVHLRHRSSILPKMAGDQVEAWLTRPDGIRLVGSHGNRIDPGAWPPAPEEPTRAWRPPEPTYRPDGLVESRPDDSFGGNPVLDEDGLFFTNYSWIAMLDPVELSHHVRVDHLREDDVAGRSAWRATLVAEPGYAPRCGGNCCELLYSEAGLRADFTDDDDVPPGWGGRTYPDAYDVALDVQTGIVVRCLPIGGGADAPWLENDILASD